MGHRGAGQGRRAVARVAIGAAAALVVCGAGLAGGRATPQRVARARLERAVGLSAGVARPAVAGPTVELAPSAVKLAPGGGRVVLRLAAFGAKRCWFALRGGGRVVTRPLDCTSGFAQEDAFLPRNAGPWARRYAAVAFASNGRTTVDQVEPLYVLGHDDPLPVRQPVVTLASRSVTVTGAGGTETLRVASAGAKTCWFGLGGSKEQTTPLPCGEGFAQGALRIPPNTGATVRTLALVAYADAGGRIVRSVVFVTQPPEGAGVTGLAPHRVPSGAPEPSGPVTPVTPVTPPSPSGPGPATVLPPGGGGGGSGGGGSGGGGSGGGGSSSGGGSGGGTSSLPPPALSIETTSLPNASVGAAYDVSLSASGGVAPYTWSLAGSSAPAWLSLSPSGVLSGTPSAAGSWTIEVSVSDSQGGSLTTTLSLSAVVGLSISVTSLPEAEVGLSYSTTLDATGGVAPYSWSFNVGGAPAGLTLSSSGELSGTPSASGSFSLEVKVTDASGQSAEAGIGLEVAPALVMESNGVFFGTVGVAMNDPLAATGGVGPYAWSVADGSPPAGLSLSSGGVLSGTPSAGGVDDVGIKVTDALGASVSATFEISIASPLEVTTTSLPAGEIGAHYSASLSATGGVAPYYFMLKEGSLPAGLNLLTDGELTGVPSGPDGTASFEVEVEDSTTPRPYMDYLDFSITIGSSAFEVTTSNDELPSLNSPSYAATLSASGGTAPYSWSLLSGALPSGLTLSSSGEISGTASGDQAGQYNFTVKVVDSSTPTPLVATKALSIWVIVVGYPTNWSGYVYSQAGEPFTAASGTFNVPDVAPSSGPTYMAEWVGIDGWGNSDLIQDGVIVDYIPGSGEQVDPFWEILPAMSTPITSLDVSVGDSVTASVAEVSGTTWQLTVTDNTTGDSFTTQQSYTGPGHSAEWIVERPELNGSLTTLADFSPEVTFTNLTYVGENNLREEEIMQDLTTSADLATPSVLLEDSFSVAYGPTAPPAP